MKNYNHTRYKKCKRCGKVINNESTWCIKCWYKHITAKIYRCKDCKKILYHKSTRCQKCYHKWASKIGLRKGKKNGMFKDGKCIVFPKCVDCGEELKNYNSKRCRKHSISLMNKNRWKNPVFKNKMKKLLSKKAKKRCSIPENNSNWKGGKTAKLRPRHTTRYKIWRKSVFVRDSFTCQRCNKRGGRLEAHHIKSWKKYPKFRFFISNGLTLCFKCHHKKGYKLL